MNAWRLEKKNFALLILAACTEFMAPLPAVYKQAALQPANSAMEQTL